MCDSGMNDLVDDLVTTLVAGPETFEGDADAKNLRKSQRQYNTSYNNKPNMTDKIKKANECRHRPHSTNLSMLDLCAYKRGP